MEEEFLNLGLDIIGLGVFNYDFGSITTESPVIQAVYGLLKEAEHRSTFYIPYWDLPLARCAPAPGVAPWNSCQTSAPTLTDCPPADSERWKLTVPYGPYSYPCNSLLDADRTFQICVLSKCPTWQKRVHTPVLPEDGPENLQTVAPEWPQGSGALTRGNAFAVITPWVSRSTNLRRSARASLASEPSSCPGCQTGLH